MHKSQPDQDLVMMKDGRMMVRRFGEVKPMDMVMALKNGIRVTMDGTIEMPDGTSRMLMDGEALTLDGEPTTVVDSDADTGTGNA